MRPDLSRPQDMPRLAPLPQAEAELAQPGTAGATASKDGEPLAAKAPEGLEAFIPSGSDLQVISWHTAKEVMALENAVNLTGKHAAAPPTRYVDEDRFLAGRSRKGFYLVDIPIRLLNHEHDPTAPDAQAPGEKAEARIEAYRALPTEAPPCLVTYAGRIWPPRGRGLAYVYNGNHRVEAARRRGDESVKALMPVEDFEFWAGTVVPNLGAPTRQIDTPQFKSWFGDSKAVDPRTGDPLVVYHGTNQPIRAFDEDRLGGNTCAASSIAFFFTEDAVEAAEYAELASRTQVVDAVNHEKLVEDLLGRIKQAEARNDWDAAERLYLEMESADLGAINADPAGLNILPVYLRAERVMVLDMEHRFDGHVVAKAIKDAKMAEFDSLKLENVWDPVGLDGRGEYGQSTTQWVVFTAHQVKSAIGNCGDFDPANPDLGA